MTDTIEPKAQEEAIATPQLFDELYSEKKFLVSKSQPLRSRL
jgi:hypothetical protein